MELELNLELGMQVVDVEVIIELRMLDMMAVPVASVDQRVDLNHRDSIREVMCVQGP